MSTETVQCANCGVRFERRSEHAMRNINNFCNPKCYGEWLSSEYRGETHRNYRKVKIQCSFCGNIIFRQPNQIKRSKCHFCNTECMWKWKKQNVVGEKHPCWKGGRRKGKNGYIYINTGDGERAEHILIAERVLGRPLKKGENVHHINMNKSDNRNSNMVICTSSYHHSIHQKMARLYAIEKFGGYSDNRNCPS